MFQRFLDWNPWSFQPWPKMRPTANGKSSCNSTFPTWILSRSPLRVESSCITQRRSWERKVIKAQRLSSKKWTTTTSTATIVNIVRTKKGFPTVWVCEQRNAIDLGFVTGNKKNNCCTSRACNRTYLSVRAEVLRRDLQSDAESGGFRHLFGEKVRFPDKAISTDDILAKFSQASLESLVPENIDNENKVMAGVITFHSNSINKQKAIYLTCNQ